LAVGFIDRASRQVFSAAQYITHRFQVRRCDVCIFVLRDQPRVFVGGGEYNFDGVAREADLTEIEALAARFDLDDLRRVAALLRQPMSKQE
jgi:hypothetical protein